MTFSKSYQPTYTYQPHDLGLVAISKISVTTHSDINFFDSHQYEDFTQNQKKNSQILEVLQLNTIRWLTSRGPRVPKCQRTCMINARDRVIRPMIHTLAHIYTSVLPAQHVL